MSRERQTFPPRDSLGERLLRYRLRLGLSQEAQAEAIGVSVRSIRRWEQNKAIPHGISRERLCSLFGIEPRHFFGYLPGEELRQLGTPEPIWYVPLFRNPYFVGREEVLRTLHTLLTSRSITDHMQALALSGLGGIGKTQVALEYAYRHAEDYRAVFWLAAESLESLMTSLQQIADRLQLPQRHLVGQSHMIAAVQNWLATHPGWLLIGDHIEDLDLLQTVLLLASSPGALLLTTRRQTLGALVEPLTLPPMSIEEGTALLLHRARQESQALSNKDRTRGIQLNGRPSPEVLELVRLLGGLPLALDQAGAYIDETGCSIADYLHRYHNQRQSLLARRGIHGGAHPVSVTTTLKLSIEQVERENPAAAELLRVCACLYREAIPEELFRAGALHLGPLLGPIVTDPYQLDQALAALRTTSLITRHPEAQQFSVHLLVQAVLQDLMGPVEVHRRQQQVVQMVNVAFPEPQPDNWPQCERLLIQALSCAALQGLIESALPETREVLFKVVSYLTSCNRYSVHLGTGELRHDYYRLFQQRKAARVHGEKLEKSALQQMDDPLQEFLTACCELHPHAWSRANELWET